MAKQDPALHLALVHAIADTGPGQLHDHVGPAADHPEPEDQVVQSHIRLHRGRHQASPNLHTVVFRYPTLHPQICQDGRMRVYGGVEGDLRRDERRSHLLEAGLDLRAQRTRPR